MSKQAMGSKIREFQVLLAEKREAGADTSIAVDLQDRSRQAVLEGRESEGLRLLEEAIDALKDLPGAEENALDEVIYNPDGSFREAKNKPIAAFVVHMEPPTASEQMFRKLEEFVAMADEYKVKLTLEFNPQWAEMITADPEKWAMVRKWRELGHELGGHHHGPSHRGTWNGYTDNPNYEEMRRKHKRNKNTQESYLGDMNDWLAPLNKMVAPETIRVGTLTDVDTDWPEGVLYSAGGAPMDSPRSRPEKRNFSGHEVTEIIISILNNMQRFEVLAREYHLAQEDEIFAVVTHCFNFNANPKPIEEWFKFLRAQDPDSKRNFTTSDAIEHWIAQNESSTEADETADEEANE